MYEQTVLRLNIQVLQGGAATCLRRGGKFYPIFCSSSENARVKELLQEAQLQLRNRASAMYFFVAKLLSIAIMTYSCI